MRIARRCERWLTRHGYTFDPAAHEREPDFTERAAQMRTSKWVPARSVGRVFATQRVERLFTPVPLVRGMNPEWVDVTPL